MNSTASSRFLTGLLSLVSLIQSNVGVYPVIISLVPKDSYMKAFLLLAANVSITRKNSKITYGLSGSWWTLLDRWYYRFHVSHTETVGKNVCYILNIRSSKNTGLQTQDMISDKKLSLFHPVLSKLSVFVFRYRLRNSSSPSISRYINKIDFRVYIYNIRQEEKVFTYIIFNFYSIPYISIKSILLFINEILLKTLLYLSWFYE